MSKDDFLDSITLMGRRAIKFLLSENPPGTSLGILTGIAGDGVLAAFRPVIESTFPVELGVVRLWHLIAGGVVAFNLRPYLKREQIDPTIENALEFIKRQEEEGRLSDWQRRRMYTKLYERVLAEVVLDEETEKEFEVLKQVVGE